MECGSQRSKAGAMKKPTAKQLQREADIEKARDHGREWFVNHTDVLLAEVYREASKIYDGDGLGKEFVVAFAEGFMQARHRRDEWLRELCN